MESVSGGINNLAFDLTYIQAIWLINYTIKHSLVGDGSMDAGVNDAATQFVFNPKEFKKLGMIGKGAFAKVYR